MAFNGIPYVEQDNHVLTLVFSLENGQTDLQKMENSMLLYLHMIQPKDEKTFNRFKFFIS